MTTFIGLDLETSGTDIDAGAVPIQLGMAVGLANTFCELVGGWDFSEPYMGSDGEGAWSSEAAEVHGLSRDDIEGLPFSSYSEAVERRALEWLPAGPKHSLVAVGWNVGSFDFPFIRRYMPRLAEQFSYRFVDLNAVAFTLAESRRRRADNPDSVPGYKSWKRRAKRAAEEMLGGENWHDAGYDAAASLAAWWFFAERA